MGTVAISTLIDMAESTLVDETNVRWSAAFLLKCYNIAKDQLVTMKRDVGATTLDFTAVAGARQTLPAGSLGIIDVRRNMGSDGSTPGRAVLLVDMYDLDHIDPDWMNLAPADVPGSDSGAVNWCVDKRNPKVFYLCPAPGAGRHLQVVHSVAPADAAAGTDILPVDDVYRTPLIDLIIARALMEDTTSGDPTKAAWFLQRAEQFLGVSRTTQMQTEPKPPAVAQSVEGV